jgi:hypothetical protein
VNRTWKYHTVANTFWGDRKVRELDPDARLLAAYLLTCPSRTSEGFYSLPFVLAADHLALTPDRLTAAFTAVAGASFAHYDHDAEVVFIEKGLKYNAPKGVKSITGAVSALDSTHGSPDLFVRFLAAADHYAPEFASAIRERYGIVPDDPSMGDVVSGR